MGTRNHEFPHPGETNRELADRGIESRFSAAAGESIGFCLERLSVVEACNAVT